MLGLCGAQEPGCQVELSIVLIYQVGWEAFITLWHLYPSPSSANNLVRVSAFGSGLAPRGSHGTKETYAPSRFSAPKATLEHYSIPASLRRLQDGSCHPPPERFTAGGVNHERNKRNFISSKKKNCATTIATATGGTENNNHHKKTWREADKQHLIFLHSHCELCQDNKDQPEPFGRFYGWT